MPQVREVNHVATRSQPSRHPNPASRARERILEAAYALFATRGIGAVGVDAIVARSGVAKMSLYRHFQSKEGLVLAFLNRREELWTHQWLEREMMGRASDPAGRLLAVFDVFHGWFQRTDFEGCTFIDVLLESESGSPIHRAAAAHLANIRSIVERLAVEAGMRDTERFAQVWHMLMKGSIVAAGEGNLSAARDAQQAGALILRTWPKQSA